MCIRDRVDTLQGDGGLGCMLSQSLKHAMSIYVFWDIVLVSAVIGVQMCIRDRSWSKQKDLNPIVVERAEGIYMYDENGTRYTDMSSQLVNLNVGFGNKAIGEAIKAQVDKYCFVGPSYAAESRATLAKMIIDLLPDNFGKVFFTNAGADANENAVKIARMFTGRNKVFSRYRSYHGSSFGAGNLTGEPRRYCLLYTSISSALMCMEIRLRRSWRLIRGRNW